MKSSPILNRLKRKLDDGNESIQNNKKYLSQSMADSIGFLSLNDDVKINLNGNAMNNSRHFNIPPTYNNNNNSNENNIFMTPSQQQQFYQNLQQQQQDFQYLQQIQQQAQKEFNQQNLDIAQPMQVQQSPSISNNSNDIFNIQPQQNITSNSGVGSGENKLLALIPFKSTSNHTSTNKYVHNYNNNNNLQYKFKFETLNQYKNPLKKEENKSLALILYSEPSEIISGSLRKELMEKRNKQKILQEIKRQQYEKDDKINQQPIVHMIEDTVVNSKDNNNNNNNNNRNNQIYDPMPM